MTINYTAPSRPWDNPMWLPYDDENDAVTELADKRASPRDDVERAWDNLKTAMARMTKSMKDADALDGRDSFNRNLRDQANEFMDEIENYMIDDILPAVRMGADAGLLAEEAQ